MTHGDTVCFGPYRLDTGVPRLTRDGVEVDLGLRQLKLICVLALRPGETVSKERLIDLAWGEVVVTLNSVDQAMRVIRRNVTMPDGEQCIETRPRLGYRFVAAIQSSPAPATDRVSGSGAAPGAPSVDDTLAPYRAWLDGRAALETLEAGAIGRARTVFTEVVACTPLEPAAHIGLANACALQFEMTRADACPDRAAIQLALRHAQEAHRLDPTSGEAWATLGFVFERVGQREDALAAARRSISLERHNWRHRLRLSAASWGDERLREALHTLQLMPGLALAHWLAASVMVGRQSLGAADDELAKGLPQIQRKSTPRRFSGIALYLLRGLIALAAGDIARALELFDCELAQEQSGHLYARECAANTWYAIGAARFRRGDRRRARLAFQEALNRVPIHPMARAALGQPPSPSPAVSAVDAAIARAVACAARGDVEACDGEAVAIEQLLATMPSGNGGWLLPVEPMLNISSRPEPWQGALAELRSRAM